MSSFYASALLCAHKHTCTPHTYARNHLFTLPFPCRGDEEEGAEREGADNSELRTRQSHLLAEVLHLINGSCLHCALNHAQIKKLVIFKINGGRGQLFDSLLKLMAAGERILFPADFVTTAQLLSSLPPSLPLWCFPPCQPLHPHCRLSGATLACQSDALTVLPPSFIQHFIIICCYCSIFS